MIHLEVENLLGRDAISLQQHLDGLPQQRALARPARPLDEMVEVGISIHHQVRQDAHELPLMLLCLAIEDAWACFPAILVFSKYVLKAS